MWPWLAELLKPRDIKGRRSAVFFQVVLLFCVNTVSKRLAFCSFGGGMFQVQCNLSLMDSVCGVMLIFPQKMISICLQ